MFRKAAISAVGALILFLAVYGILSLLAKPIPDHAYFNPDQFLVIAHRGGRNLGPEGTIYTFTRAAALGVDVLELDVRTTKDGKLVLLHDRTLDRTTNGAGPVDTYALDDLKKMDAAFHWTPDGGSSYPLRGRGITIPTLNEVFDEFSDLRMNIEIKDPDTSVAHALCTSVRDYGMSNKVMVASFDSATLKEFRSMCPEVATSASATEAMLFYWLQRAYLESAFAPAAQALQVPVRYGETQVVTRRLLDAAHARNMRVHVWTVNDIETMRRLLDLGVDGIMTDFPARLLEVADGRGKGPCQ